MSIRQTLEVLVRVDGSNRMVVYIPADVRDKSGFAPGNAEIFVQHGEICLKQGENWIGLFQGGGNKNA